MTTQPISIPNGDGTYRCADVSGDVFAGCEGSVDAPGTICSLPTRTVCDARSSGFVASSCSCMPTASGNRWQCLDGSGSNDCPLERPADASACGASDAGKLCEYLRRPACTCDADRNAPFRRLIDCRCEADTQTWRCRNQYPEFLGAEEATFVEAPCYGSGYSWSRPPLDEDLAIRELTDAQAQAWCEWYLQPDPRSPPAMVSEAPPEIVNGCPVGWASGWCAPEGPGNVAMAVSIVPGWYCAQLLRVGSCDAPLRALDDCFLSISNGCEAVGEGCRALGANPRCRQTVVSLGTPKTCAVPIP